MENKFLFPRTRTRKRPLKREVTTDKRGSAKVIGNKRKRHNEQDRERINSRVKPSKK